MRQQQCTESLERGGPARRGGQGDLNALILMLIDKAEQVHRNAIARDEMTESDGARRRPMSTRSQRVASAIDATLFGMFVAEVFHVPVPRVLLAALSATSVVLISVVVDAFFGFQTRRAERGRSRLT